MIQIYRSATQLVAAIAFPLALLLSVYAEPVVYAWTGDRTAAAWCAEVLPWFALGNALLAVAAFQSLLQKAFGDMRLQVVGSTVSVLIQVPVIYVAAVRYGAVGAGVAWLGIRLLWFLVWPAIVHARFVPGLHRGWLRKDVLPAALVGVALAIVLQGGVPLDMAHGRTALAGVLVAIGIGATALMALSSRYVRGLVADLTRQLVKHSG